MVVQLDLLLNIQNLNSTLIPLHVSRDSETYFWYDLSFVYWLRVSYELTHGFMVS